MSAASAINLRRILAQDTSVQTIVDSESENDDPLTMGPTEYVPIDIADLDTDFPLKQIILGTDGSNARSIRATTGGQIYLKHFNGKYTIKVCQKDMDGNINFTAGYVKDLVETICDDYSQWKSARTCKEEPTEELAAAEEEKQAKMVKNLQDAQLSESTIKLLNGMGTPINAFEIAMQVESVEEESIQGAVKRQRQHLQWNLCLPSLVKEEDQSCYQVVNDRWPISSVSQSATQSTPRKWKAWCSDQ